MDEDGHPANPYAAESADRAPVFTLHASDPLSAMMVRFWANANEKERPLQAAEARVLAARMDAWRARNRGIVP